MDLLPALDLYHGRVVRLRQGEVAHATVYVEEPAHLLEEFAAAGVVWAHLVDLDAAFGEPPQTELLRRLAASAARPHLQLGGGLRSSERCREALAAGFDRVVVGSLVATEPERFAELARALPGKLVPALDCRQGQVRLRGWREEAHRPAEELAAALAGLPCAALLVTDVERDGMLAGPNLELAVRLARAAGLPAQVSGGVRSVADVAAARQLPEVGGVIVGRALLDGVLGLAAALACAHGIAPSLGGGA